MMFLNASLWMAFIGVSLFFITLFWCLNRSDKRMEYLRTNGQVTIGYVIRKTHRRHSAVKRRVRRVVYIYTDVAGVRHCSAAEVTKSFFQKMHSGYRIRVFYDTTNPCDSYPEPLQVKGSV